MFNKPNYTQTPNDFFDEVAKTLKEGELRVMLVIMRQTFGWGNKQWDRISISQLMQKSGMTKDAVVRSTKTLVSKKIITKHKTGKKGQEESWYSLVVENPAEFQNPIDDSNNSYQSSKKTPPSLFRRPTKETTTKERREEAQAPPPTFFNFKGGIVRIEATDFDKLVSDFGEITVKETIENLCEFAKINPKRFKQYACHATVIRKWIREDIKKSRISKNGWSQTYQENCDLAALFKQENPNFSKVELTQEGVVFHGGESHILLKYTNPKFKEEFLSRLKQMGVKKK